MQLIRLLVVDDAAAIRQLVADALSIDSTFEVVGSAATGGMALAKIPQLKPDLVILDVEMPDMDGLETLSAIRKTHPQLPVIMFSAYTEQGAAATIDALTRGADDYVTKPTSQPSPTAAMQYIREAFIPKIKGLCTPASKPMRSSAYPASRPAPVRQRAPQVAFGRRQVDIVAIGVSTGGPNALMELIPALPADFPVPIVIVQHMPRLFTGILSAQLDSRSALRVREGEFGRQLEPAQVWLAPGDAHMALEQRGDAVLLQLHQGPPENGSRPAVDVLFRSAAEQYGPAVLAVVLTGMGHDGLRGCEAISAAGGQILVQDEATSIVWGMPGVVAEAGLADQVLPLEQIEGAIMQRVSVGRRSPRAAIAALQTLNR